MYNLFLCWAHLKYELIEYFQFFSNIHIDRQLSYFGKTVSTDLIFINSKYTKHYKFKNSLFSLIIHFNPANNIPISIEILPS